MRQLIKIVNLARVIARTYTNAAFSTEIRRKVSFVAREEIRFHLV